MTPTELKKRYGIGLTGGVATGKSSVARMIAARGYPVIDADVLARKVVLPGSKGLKAVVREFGEGVLARDGSLDRRALGRIVFADAEKRRRLEGILHPLIREALDQTLTEMGLTASPRLFFYEASLLFETRVAEHFREIWVTYCPEQVQIERLMRRDGKDEKAARQVMASQMPAKEKAARANLVIDTAKPLDEVELDVEAALARLE